jgi:hypothetical protein
MAGVACGDVACRVDQVIPEKLLDCHPYRQWRVNSTARVRSEIIVMSLMADRIAFVADDGMRDTCAAPCIV